MEATNRVKFLCYKKIKYGCDSFYVIAMKDDLQDTIKRYKDMGYDILFE